MDSLIGPWHTEGSKQEVLIKREGCSIFQLPRQPQPNFCWALSISTGVFLSVSVSFYSCLSHCLTPPPLLHTSTFQLCFYLAFSVSVTFSIRLSNTISDHTLSYPFLSFFFLFLLTFCRHYCPFLFLSLLFPFSLQQLSENCLLCEMRQKRLASSIRVREKERDSVRRL